MGNTNVKSYQKPRNKKQVHWKAAARPPQPGKPHLISETENTPDLVTIRWEKPTNDGGAPIIGYLIEHRRTGSPHWVRSTPLLVQAQELTISGLEPGWRYQFRISAENAVGMSDPSELSEPITVTLQRSAVTAPRFTEELRETTVLEDQKAEFLVHFLGQPAPRVCWFKDSFEIFSSRRIRIITDTEKSVLTIHQTSLADEGEIKCTATNRAGHVSTKAKLTVEAPPNIRLPRQYEDGLLFELGELIRLKVSVAGRPTPLVFWSHNGESIRNNDRYEISFSDQSSFLKINDANREDRGEYHVKAVNKLGEDNQSFLVTVTDKPSPPGRARVVMALGRSVTLSWSTPRDDGGCKVGNYVIEYYRLGWNVWLKAATTRQLTTMLGDLIEGSEYKFRVKAESPYGMSDPGEESDVVFVPDPNRGILQPTRSHSQPRDIDQQPVTPVARRKNKQRSQSSTRIGETSNALDDVNQIPKRPERSKVKSPPKSPEASRSADKRIVDTKANKEIFERSNRSSVVRDLAYGSPGIKLKKDTQPMNKLQIYSSDSEKSRTPSPTINRNSITDGPPNESSIFNKGSISTTGMPTMRTLIDKNDNSTGSSELMLVLYPGENEYDQFDSDYDSIPPPLSLSAPEIGSEDLCFNILRKSASSSELLHERVMTRLYQAAEAEEKEMERRRRSLQGGNDIPTIQINSVEDQIPVGLERQSSIKRRLSLGGSTKKGLMNQRRLSLKNSLEKEEEAGQDKLRRFKLSPGEEEGIFIKRQRSKSEEDEEKAFEELRNKMDLIGKPTREKYKVRIIDQDEWDDDYSSSTDESESDDDVDVKFFEKVSKKYYESDEEVAETYHPGNIKQTTKENEPFEILTIRKDPPSPDFVPKPILKKTEYEEHVKRNTLPLVPQSKIRSHSPIPRGRSQSLVDSNVPLPFIRKPIVGEEAVNHPRQRSFSLLPREEIFIKKADVPQIPTIPENPEPFSIMHSISAAATISGITAASIVIPNKLIEKQEDADEAKVVIDHYGDIVRNYGNRRKSIPQIYSERGSLNKIEGDSQVRIDGKEGNKRETHNTSVKTLQSSEETKSFVMSSEISRNVYTPQYRNIEVEHTVDNRSNENAIDKTQSSKIFHKTSDHQQSINQTSLEASQASTPHIHKARRTSASPMRSTKTRNTSASPSMRNRSVESSKRKELPPKRRPMLREIMTQTSEGLMDSFDNQSRSPSPMERSKRQEELIAQAEVKVHRFVDYTTDLAMFVVACWLYLFQNELMAIPVLLVMVYRQLQEEISKRIPKWILRRMKRKSKK